jgi:predicted nucleotidyltransferase
MRRCPIKEVAKKAAQVGTPFLVIGGYAVLAHGYVRATDDLDLLVSSARRAEWEGLLAGLEMSVKNDTPTFMQFKPKDESVMDVDLMFVSKEVFDKLATESQDAEVDGVRVKSVSLLHLIALKCHALQHSKSLRRLKDMDDLVQLILVNRLDLNKPEVRATILKHGNADIYEKLRYACSNE